MSDFQGRRYPLALALLGLLALSGLPAGAPSAVFSVSPAWAIEDPAAFDRTYKQSGKLASQVAQRYDGVLRETASRLGEVARQNPADLARTPLAIETMRTNWPIVTYVMGGTGPSVIPAGRGLLSPGELEEVSRRKSQVFLKGSTIVVAVPAGLERVTTAEIPLAAFQAPLEAMRFEHGAALLLDENGRSVSRSALGSEDQELLKSIASEASTTLVSKTSVLSMARIPAAGWSVIIRLPLAEAYRGIVLPEFDERALPTPLYLVKRTQGASLEGVGKGALYSFAGLAVLAVALVFVRRRLRGETALTSSFAGLPSTLSASLPALQTGGRAVLQALVGEKPQAPLAENRPAPPPPPPPPMQAPVDGATSGVWRDTLQAQVSYLLGEFRQIQEQLQTVAGLSQLEALQVRMEAEFESFTEALRQRMDLESRRMETLRAQQTHLAELNEGKLGMLESELESFRNQGMHADREANEKIEVLVRAVQQLQGALEQSQRENAQLREELGTLSARVHRIVKLLAKGKIA